MKPRKPSPNGRKPVLSALAVLALAAVALVSYHLAAETAGAQPPAFPLATGAPSSSVPGPALTPGSPPPGAQPAVPPVSPDHAAISADPTWEQQFPGSSPEPRCGMGFVYDRANRKIVLVGGANLSTTYNDTWEYDGAAWTRRDDLPQKPPARNRPSIAYDPIRQVTVLFGGNSGNTFYNDTWEYDGRTWVHKSPLSPPSPRNGATMAYDEQRRRMILFGGYRWQGSMVFFDETWEYDGLQWTQRFPTHHPSQRETAGLAYDRSRKLIVLFGGGKQAGSYVYNDTWEWNGDDWNQRTDLPSAPPARWAHAMAYDESRQRIVLANGLTGLYAEYRDTWEYDGHAWTQNTTQPSPLERWDLGLAYDSGQGRTVLFGGAYYDAGYRFRNDTWHYAAPLPAPERPVVLLPGGPGSVLYRDNAANCSGEEHEVWMAYDRLRDWMRRWTKPAAQLLWNNELYHLALDPESFYQPADACDRIFSKDILYGLKPDDDKPVDFYQSLYQNLKDQGFTVYPCHYDWRRFLRGERAYDLPVRIDECVQAASGGTGQVDIVAHSLGGLAARAYLLSDPARAAKVHTVISLGTPYLGTPALSFRSLRYGESGISPLDRLLYNKTLKDLSHDWPATYQILPSQTLFELHGFIHSFGYFRQDYQSFKTYESMKTFLSSNYAQTLVNAAEALHSAPYMDNWQNDPLTGISYNVFVGTGLPTACMYMEKTWKPFGWEIITSKDIIKCVGRSGGDGTVPQTSADLGGVSDAHSGRATICYFPGVDHGKLTSNAQTFDSINRTLRGVPPGPDICPPRSAQGDRSPQEIAAAQPTRELVVHGLGLVHVWDDQGRHAGPRPDLLIENDIPEVTYDAGEEDAFVTLPPNSIFTVTVQMSSTLPLEVKFWTLAPADALPLPITQTIIFQDVPSAVGGEATIIYDPLADPATFRLDVDQDGNGSPELSLPPTGVLGAEESQDQEPPVTTITVVGQHDPLGFFTGPVVITLDATDDASGLHHIEYSLDGGATGAVYTGPLTLTAEDVPLFYAQSVDRAGNREYPWVVRRLRPQARYLPLLFRQAP